MDTSGTANQKNGYFRANQRKGPQRDTEVKGEWESKLAWRSGQERPRPKRGRGSAQQSVMTA